jgi:hypothetical protein
MDAFTDFVLEIVYPPNPIRRLDNTLTGLEEIGRAFYFAPHTKVGTTGDGSCNSCHTLDPYGNASEGVARPGFFGTNGDTSISGETQLFKVPHLRNMYQKVGRFGQTAFTFFQPFAGDAYLGDQIRGVGFLHDGSMDTLFHFAEGDLEPSAMAPSGVRATELSRRGLEAFLLAYPSNLSPIVGQQVTFSAHSPAAAGGRIDLLVARALVGECDLVAKTRDAQGELGWYFDPASQTFEPSRSGASLGDAALRQVITAADLIVTYTCTPPGSGRRIGIDRDLDGFRDGDETAAGSDPANPASTPR